MGIAPEPRVIRGPSVGFLFPEDLAYPYVVGLSFGASEPFVAFCVKYVLATRG